jgi:hypothetical protein
MFPKMSNSLLIIGGIASLVIILGFFGVDAGSLRKAMPEMNAQTVWASIGLIASLSLVAVGLFQKFRRSKVTIGNVESKVREWFDAFGWGTKRLPADTSFHFGFEIRLKNNIPLTVFRLKEHEQYLTLVAAVEVGPEHRSLFEKLSKSDQVAVSREVQIELARAKVGSVIDLPNRVTVEKLIPITDSLTEASLVDAILGVQFAVVLITFTIVFGIERRQSADD